MRAKLGALLSAVTQLSRTWPTVLGREVWLTNAVRMWQKHVLFCGSVRLAARAAALRRAGEVTDAQIWVDFCSVCKRGEKKREKKIGLIETTNP